MSLAATSAARRQSGLSPWLLAWAAFLLLTILVWLGSDSWAWAVKYPKAWIWPLKKDVTTFMKWLINDATFGLFTFKEFTRSIAWLIDWPYTLARGCCSRKASRSRSRARTTSIRLRRCHGWPS